MPKPHRHQATWAPRMSIPTSISVTASHGSNRVRIACGVLLPQTQISPCITTNVRRLFLPPTFPHRVRATSLPAVLAALAHADATTCLDIDLDLHAATILDKRVARLRPTICCAPARLTVIRADFFVFLLGAPAQFLRTATLAAHMRDPYRHTAVPSHNTAIKFVECLSGPQWAKGRKGCHSPVMFGRSGSDATLQGHPPPRPLSFFSVPGGQFIAKTRATEVGLGWGRVREAEMDGCLFVQGPACGMLRNPASSLSPC